MVIKANIKYLFIILLIILNIEITENIIYSDDNYLFTSSNDKNWIELEKALLSNKIYEYPPSLYFKFKSNGIVYTIHYYYTTKKVIRNIYKGFWKINYKEKSIYINLKDCDGKDFVSEQYFSFKIFYKNKKKEEFVDLIVLYKNKNFVEPEDYEQNAYYGDDNYLVLSVAQGIPEKKDKEFLDKL